MYRGSTLQVKKRMTIDEFVRNNRGINEKVVVEEGRERKVPEDLPRSLLTGIYTNIQVMTRTRMAAWSAGMRRSTE